MNYLSLSFVAFVAIAVVLYYILPRKARPGVLLVASVAFYAIFDLRCVAFLLFTAVTTYLCARIAPRLRHKGWLIGGCIAANVAVWFAIKEVPWLLTTAQRGLSLMGVDAAVPTLSLMVPVGISYYTLQGIGYLVDVSKGRYAAEKNFCRYLLFLSWFPAIVQGPISRYHQLMPQLMNDKKFCYDGMRSGLVLVLFGLIKKMVIADRLGILVNHVFSHYQEMGGAILYLAAVGYAVQLYTDFSGCVDICRGISGLFGVELVENFNRPYSATSIRDFWGRWHISLSSWLKDYIYIPLGGNRKGTLHKYWNIIVVFLLSGLWHGAGFHFFLWGLMHAVYQIVGSATLPLRKKVKSRIGIREGSRSERVYQVFITFHLVVLAWVMFRAGGVMTGLDYICTMFSGLDVQSLFNGTLFTFGLSKQAFVLVLAHVVLLFISEHRYRRQEEAVVALLDTHLIIRWTLYLLLLFDVLLFGVYGSGYDMTGFMYGGF